VHEKAPAAEVESFQKDIGPFDVAAETTRMAMVFTDAVKPDHPIIFCKRQLSFLNRICPRRAVFRSSEGLFSRARIRDNKSSNCQNATKEQHQENRPAQKAASRLDRRLYDLFSIFMH
jgi:hypothetical protein